MTRARSGAPIAVLGSGFAGSVLARALNARGLSVTLIERGEHPRFALGESSTPLAAICLERLAERYGLSDLSALAAHGRWTRELPGLRRGLKRGFTFYGHRPGIPYANDASNGARMLVAASPDAEIADAHWLRSDVDHHLVRRAAEEGVEYVDRCELDALEGGPSAWRLKGSRAGRPVRMDASFVVDATGAAGFVSRALGRFPQTGRAAGPGRPAGAGLRALLETGLVFGHFERVGSFREAALAGGARLDRGPYPEERAAVHHLLEEGWLYALPFDHGVVSAGLVIDRGHPSARDLLQRPPADAWGAVLARYPTLAAQFEAATPVRPIATVPLLQRRLERAAGHGWAALPNTFFFGSPMFSTGIAWSLVAVERLAQVLGGEADEPKVREYDQLLALEADHISRLIAPAYAHRSDFQRFSAWALAYFAAASFHEARQRLCDPPDPAGWHGVGFLGACDSSLRASLDEAELELAHAARGADRGDLRRRVASRLADRDIAGLGRSDRRNLYPVDLEALRERADLLGLAPAELEARWPRLRGPGP